MPRERITSLGAAQRRTAQLAFKHRRKLWAAGSVLVIVLGSWFGASLKQHRQVKQARARYEEADFDGRLDILHGQRERLLMQKSEIEAKLIRLKDREGFHDKRSQSGGGRPL